MSPPSPDKDFILGVLAVQMGYTTAMEVMRVEAAWLADPAVSIPERLVAGGAITRQQLESIEATAARLIAGHGGDATSALQGLSADSTLVKASASTVAGGPADVDASSMEAVEVTAEHAGRYSYSGGSRDTAEIGRGGLGRGWRWRSRRWGCTCVWADGCPGWGIFESRSRRVRFWRSG